MPIFILGFAVLVGIFGLFVIGGSFYTVDQGDRAVVTRLGEVVAVADPGFHTKTPFMESAHDISVRTVLHTWPDLAAYSRDQQAAALTLSIAWRANPGQVEEIYTEYRDLEGLGARVLFPRAVQAAKVVFGGFNAATAISERARLNAEVAEQIRMAVEGAPLTIESVQIENIDFSDAYEQSVEQRMLAEVEVAKLRQNAEREKVSAEITVTQAKATADAVRASAEAAADSTRVRAIADAEAFRLRAIAEAEGIAKRGEALRNNPELVELTKAERWDGKLPTTMLPGQTLPFVEVKP